jgi:hypothetical protein
MVSHDDDSKWYEIVVPDPNPNSLNGQFVAPLLSFVSNILDTRVIVLDDLEGAGIDRLVEMTLNKVVSLDQVIDLIENVTQFDWCNFLFFSSEGIVPGKDQSYPDFISNTIATVRAVDDTEIHLYTQNINLVNKIQERYLNVNVTSGELSSFSYSD